MAAVLGLWWVTVVVVLVGGAGTAAAHAFLIATNPPQGARLVAAPSVITMNFSEGVISVGVTVELQGTTRPLPVTIQHTAPSSALHVTLGAHPDGVYVVTWHAVATDTHLSDGEFAFGVGRGGMIPVAHQHSAGPDIPAVAATVAFLTGLALALGGLVTGLAVDSSVSARSGWIALGMTVASVGAVGNLVVAVGRQGDTLTAATGATGAAAVLVAAGMVATRVSPRRLPPLVGLLAAGVAWSTDGHPATISGALGAVINAIHLTVGAVWVGTLGWFVASVIRRRRERSIAWEIARRYSRLALPLVVVLGVAGGASAWEVLPSWSALWSSGYGQLLLVKTGLFAVALGLAATGRWRGIGRGQAGTLRRSVPLEALAVAVIVVVTAVLVSVAPPVGARSASELLGPAPLTGPVARDAGLAGEITVSVAAGGGQLQFQVFAPNTDTRHVSLDIAAFFPDGRKDVGLFPRTCGNGCFTQALNLSDGITHLDIAATDPGWVGGTYHAALVWPPPATKPQLLARVIAAMDGVRSMVVDETVTSNSAGRFFGHPQTVSGRFYVGNEPYSNADPENPGVAPAVTDVQPLTVGGPGLTVYLPIPDEPVWVTMWLYPDGRIRRARTIDPDHDIEDTFTYPRLGASAPPPHTAP